MRFITLVFLACLGCSYVATPHLDPSRVSGVYQNGDGFWPRWLILNDDGTFSYRQLTDSIKMVEGGGFVPEGGWALAGRWMFISPDRIEMTVDGNPAKITVFLRSSNKHEFAILEPDLFPNILKHWKDDDGLGYLKKQKPNPERSVSP
jgi:hypothetical protein